MGHVVERLAQAHLAKILRGYAGPCQMPDCQNRATVEVSWAIHGFGEARGWYCDDHAPEEAIEERQHQGAGQ